MAKDLFHNTVKTALQKEGWLITHDPYQLRYGVADIYIDLAAEEAIAAEKEGRKIAVEVKSFAGGSTISEFHTALGQFLNYRIAIEVSDEPERILALLNECMNSGSPSLAGKGLGVSLSGNSPAHRGCIGVGFSTDRLL
jgi:hypothetical protein